MSHSFLKESKLYLEYSGSMYRIYTTTAISFSQTFAEDSYPVKTLHDQSKMFEGSTITKANPASFSFTVPLTVEKDESIVLNLANDLVTTVDSGITTQQLKVFSMYVKTGSSTFKVENCIITSASFNFNPRDTFKVEVAGQGTKLIRVGDENYNLGTIQSESATRTSLLVFPVLSVDSLNMTSILSTTLQIQNNINWSPFENLQTSLAGTMQYPSAYTVTGRIVSGAIKQYQTDNTTTQFDDFSVASNITIKGVQVGKAASSSGFITININPAMFTARLEVSEIYTHSYDFRSLDQTPTIAYI
jgi:stringent starvation protein B